MSRSNRHAFPEGGVSLHALDKIWHDEDYEEHHVHFDEAVSTEEGESD